MSSRKMPRLSEIATRVQEVKAQFDGLDLKEAHSWPALPKAVLYLMVGLATAVLTWFLYLQSLQTDLAEAKSSEISLRSEFERKLVKSVSLDGLKKQREQVQQYVQELEKQLPSKSEMSPLLSDINQAGIGRNLQFELFKPGAEQVRDYYAELPISLSVSGQFHDIGMFVADIAQLPRIVTLSNLSMVPRGSDGSLSFQAVAKTYRYLDADEALAQRKNQGAKR